MRKIYFLTLALAACSSIHSQELRFLSFGLGTPGLDEPQMLGIGISSDGRYICGVIDNDDGYFIGDLAENKFIYEWTIDEDFGSELRHVDDNGVAIGYNGPGITFSIDGVETILEVPNDNFSRILGEDISNDGSLLVGSLIGEHYVQRGAYSRNGGEWTELPAPEPGGYYEFTAKYCSGDGKVILGNVGTMGELGPATIWIMNDEGEYESFPIYDKYMVMSNDDLDNDEKLFLALSPSNVSNSGEYVLMRGTLKDMQVSVPVVYNTKTKELTIWEELQNIDVYSYGVWPTAIADDGTIIGNLGVPFMSPAGFILKPGETQAQTFAQAFPAYAKIFNNADGKFGHEPTDISADGRYIIGFIFYDEDSADSSAPAYYRTYIIDTQAENGIDEISVSDINAIPEAIYSIDGKQVPTIRKGLNIIRMRDGSVKKVIK